MIHNFHQLLLGLVILPLASTLDVDSISLIWYLYTKFSFLKSNDNFFVFIVMICIAKFNSYKCLWLKFPHF